MPLLTIRSTDLFPGATFAWDNRDRRQDRYVTGVNISLRSWQVTYQLPGAGLMHFDTATADTVDLVLDPFVSVFLLKSCYDVSASPFDATGIMLRW